MFMFMQTLHRHRTKEKGEWKHWPSYLFMYFLHAVLIGAAFGALLSLMKKGKNENNSPKKISGWAQEHCCWGRIFIHYFIVNRQEKLFGKYPWKNIIKHKTCLIFHVHRQISFLSVPIQLLLPLLVLLILKSSFIHFKSPFENDEKTFQSEKYIAHLCNSYYISI